MTTVARSPALIGRHAELEKLQDALCRVAARHGTTIFLIGESGIGKTRLAAAATDLASASGMRTLRGRGSTIRPMIPYRPLAEALLPLSRNDELWSSRTLDRYRPLLARLLPGLDVVSAPVSDGSPLLLAEAVLQLLTAAAGEHGCLLALDDLQDADTETLAVVEYLVDNVQATPVVLVAAMGSEPSKALELAQAAHRRGVGDLVEVGHLDRAATTELVAACLRTSTQQVPAELAARVWTDSVGHPFVAEELLYDLVASGRLVRNGHSWKVAGSLRTGVPSAVVGSIADRLRPLGEPVEAMLSVAAVLGQRFSLPVVQRVTSDPDTLARLRAAMAANLVVPVEPVPGWYAFRHPLAAEAILAALAPAERAKLSGRAAQAVQDLHPDLPEDWGPLAATLWSAAGEPIRAGQLLTTAARRALDQGAPGSVIALLDRAGQLLGRDRNQALARAEVLHLLLNAVGQAGQLHRTADLAATLRDLAADGLPADRLVALHASLAGLFGQAGQAAAGLAQVDQARRLLKAGPANTDTASIDLAEASLMAMSQHPDRLALAAGLALRAARSAERAGRPEIACEALQLLGAITRGQDVSAADARLEQSVQLARRHDLPYHLLVGSTHLAVSAWLLDGDAEGLRRAGAEAYRLGALGTGYRIDAVLALHAVLRGEHQSAEQMIEDCWRAVSRARLCTVRYVLMSRAVLAAHQARRADMEEALAEFRHWGGPTSPELPLTFGLARVFCALLEEDRELADRELALGLGYESENPSGFHLVGRNGLHLLLGVLDGRLSRSHHDLVTTTEASRMRWNAQFVHLAHAVLLGREGRLDEATEAMVGAHRAARPYPMAIHLGLRLVADEAHEHGWGTPVEWLRAAEAYFQRTGAVSVASACRAGLRRLGAPVPQRRAGIDSVPPTLRAVGVTVREYEVFRLLVERLGNKAIASRLQISPRTAEKHVASLLTKTALPHRDALSQHARELLAP